MSGGASSEQRRRFVDDGFVMVDDVLGLAGIDHSVLSQLHESFERVFRGEFVTGTRPDEVNWQHGLSDPTLTRQICNGWRADPTIASVVMNEAIAQAIGVLMGWDGVRLIQDNVLWKPPGARSLGFHRDNAYLDWYRPTQMATCWIALDATTAHGGTLEFARGSHKWQASSDVEVEFHAPIDHRASVAAAAVASSATFEPAPIEVPSGGGSFHHGDTWHGSGPNRSTGDRRALVIHCAPAEVRFHRPGFESGNGPVYSRYARPDSDEMDERHFPILWRSDVR